jgi:hypothetical protein
MSLPKEFKIVGGYTPKYYEFKVSDTNYTRKQLIEGLDRFKTFMDAFKCTADEIISIVDKLGITDKSLFEYQISPTPFLDGKKAIYTVKYGYVWGYRKEIETFYDVYISSNTYVSLALGDIARELMFTRFPYFNEAPFVEVEKRFKDNINNLPKNTNTKLSDIEHDIIFDNNLTIKDLINLYLDDGYKDSTIVKSLFHIYSDSNWFFLQVSKREHEHSLQIPTKAFFEKDWEAIENVKVSSVCLYDDNGELIKGKWFEGKQKDAPYFKYPLVEEFRKKMMG